MNADAIATRMAVLTRALPSRVLLVDDDELETELMANRLTGAGFEVSCVANGQEALALIERQWFPLVITDWQMPVMDGIAFTEALRGRGVADTYVIMLTMRETSVDYERGYASGVDDYLSKRVSDPELFARIHAGFNTLALRRSLRQMQAAVEQSVTIDAESGAFAVSELYTKLHNEIRRAQRYGRQLAIINVGVQALERSSRRASVAPNRDVLHGVVQTMEAVVRGHIDWIGRLATPEVATFAVVLPEAGVCEAPEIKERIQSALRRYADTVACVELAFTFGVAALERGSSQGAALDANELLQVAELCRRCAGCTGPEQLSAVQRSVTCHAAIVCRHGYVVDGECRLKGKTGAAKNTDAAPVLAG